MIRTMRLGAFALTAVSTLALGVAFTGCGSSDDAVDTTDTNPPDDTNPTDSNKPDTNTGDTPDTNVPGDTNEAGTDTAPPPADRQVTIVFAQPDAPATGLYVCLGGFSGADPTAGTPSAAIGPVGIPNDPADPSKGFKSGFTYGTALPFPVNDIKAQVALNSLTVVAYFLETLPATGKTCTDVWADVKGDTKRWFKVNPAGVATPTAPFIAKGKSYVLALDGCKDPATKNAAFAGICGTGTTDNRSFNFKELDISKTAPTAGFEVQMLHASQFAGITGAIPSFQNVDIYIQPMMAGSTGDAGADTGDTGDAETSADAGETSPPADVPAGTPIKIASGIKDLDLGALTEVTSVAGDPTKALFVILPKDAPYCVTGATCPAVPLPAAPFLAGYKAIGGGFSKNQMFWLTGSPAPATATPTDKTSALIRIGMTNIKQF